MNATTSGATSVIFSPDGKLLAAAYADGTVRLWDRVLFAVDGVRRMIWTEDVRHRGRVHGGH